MTKKATVVFAVVDQYQGRVEEVRLEVGSSLTLEMDAELILPNGQMKVQRKMVATILDVLVDDK